MEALIAMAYGLIMLALGRVLEFDERCPDDDEIGASDE